MAWRYIITTWASLPMMSLRVVPNSLCRKLDRRFTFDWLTSYLNCKLALNCASSPRHFSSQDLQEGNCHFLSEWQENQIIISFWNGWHITQGTQQKKCVMLGFSLMQLVTSKPGACAIPEAQLMQSLPWLFHAPAKWHIIANVYPSPTQCVSAFDHHLAMFLGFCRGPPLPSHALDAGTDSHAPTCFSSCRLCA
jgi:hypothetical protein